MSKMTEKDAFVAFNLTDQVGPITVEKLIFQYGNIVSAWENYPHKISRQGKAVDLEVEYALAARYKVQILTPVDEEYPPILKRAAGHPLALYVLGEAAALSKPGVSIVGTRRATTYGLDEAYAFAYDLAEAGWSVISGLALGIDAQAHRGALAAQGTTVGVLGSALDCFYPEQNRKLAREIVQKGGAVVSEFPFGREPDQQTFPQRNHIVAALSAGTLAIECPAKSGTLITCRLAAELGRPVMALPARVTDQMSSGCFNLIRKGAILVRNANDVMSALSDLIPHATLTRKPTDEDEDTDKKTAAPPPVSAPQQPELPTISIEESLILRELDAAGVTMDHLVDKTGFDAAKVAALCMALRLKGRVRYLPGNRVALPRDAH
jgi:DNA processing protein